MLVVPTLLFSITSFVSGLPTPSVLALPVTMILRTQNSLYYLVLCKSKHRAIGLWNVWPTRQKWRQNEQPHAIISLPRFSKMATSFQIRQDDDWLITRVSCSAFKIQTNDHINSLHRDSYPDNVQKRPILYWNLYSKFECFDRKSYSPFLFAAHWFAWCYSIVGGY